ncbi:hypothetical protein INR49_023723 [Caranx melampygus]|nr:hypothetical protein INR49_023723 [Caranx melampygus]
MPGISSTAPRYENWDMDHLDHYQHYFYDDHDDEDFFKSTAPSEDIWKKFELVPTPPMSPIRAVEGSGRVGLLYPSLGDKLEAQCAAAETPTLSGLAADCVDPAAVLTFPLTGGCKKQQHNYAAPSPDTLPPPAEPPRKRVRQEASTQAIQPHQNSHYHQPRPGHAPLNLDSRRSHVTVAGVRSESPNLSASSPTSSTSPSSPPSSSSSSSSSSSHSQSSAAKSHSLSHLSSPQSSDCEDTDKRRAHNFLERKRRNDLRSRFLSLRDEIPGLADCPKTPKVAILTRATEYLQQLHTSERQKAQERKQLKARQLQLLQRLAQLKRS